MSTLGRAIAIAAAAHQQQSDKAGQAYILHPLRMMMQLQTEAEQIVAVLHDVVEDTPWTFEQLRAEGFSDEILAALDAVTNRPGESYEEFVARAAVNPIARRVKMADLEDNMNVRRMSELTTKDIERLQKYHRAWWTLKHAQLA